MLIQDLNHTLKVACPVGKQMVFAVLLSGNPSTLYLSYMGRTGRTIIDKFFNTHDTSEKLRRSMNVSQSTATGLVAFVFLGFINTGRIRYFRVDWYRRHSRKANSKFGSLHTAKELLLTVPNRDFQFHFKLDLSTRDIIDTNSFSKFDASVGSPAALTALAERVHIDNLYV
jgi:hypothetical protein